MITRRNRHLSSLVKIVTKTGGRDATGKISVRHIGGRAKRFYRQVDFKRDKFNVPGKVVALEYDPNRTSYIAQINYIDGEKRYILAPEGLVVGERVVAGENVEVKPGNALPLKSMPVGTVIHNVELVPGKGGQIIRSAGSSATLMAVEGSYALIRLASGEVRKVSQECLATVGALSRAEWKNTVWGKAGRVRHLGVRPTVRGVAMSPRDHPHGGGEGRSGIGMPSPKSPWGHRTLGKKTRKKGKYSDKYIVERKKSRRR